MRVQVWVSIALILGMTRVAVSQTTSVTASWEYPASAEITGFRLYARDVGQTVEQATVVHDANDPALRSVMMQRQSGRVYCYSVTAYKAEGSQVAESGKSNEVCHGVLTRPVLLRVE